METNTDYEDSILIELNAEIWASKRIHNIFLKPRARLAEV